MAFESGGKVIEGGLEAACCGADGRRGDCGDRGMAVGVVDGGGRDASTRPDLQ